MKLDEVYRAAGGDAALTVSRLGGEERVRRFLRCYPADSSYDRLRAALAAEDREAAFLAVHTLKGVALTLGLNRVGNAAARLTEQLRVPGARPEQGLLAELERAQEETLAAIAGLEPG